MTVAVPLLLISPLLVTKRQQKKNNNKGCFNSEAFRTLKFALYIFLKKNLMLKFSHVK